MKHRSRRVPPLPPAPPPEAIQPDSRLPALRPRRLDNSGFGSRTDQARRPVQLPEPPTHWPLESAAAPKGTLPQPPQPPENLRQVLQDLADKYSRTTPAAETRSSDPDEVWKAAPSGRPEAARGAKRLNISVICTKADSPFVLVFDEGPSVFGRRYKLVATLPNVGTGGETAASIAVPVSSLDWAGITCPHCGNRVQPIFCDACNRLACDGRVTEDDIGTFFRCAPSCGCIGWVRPGLKNVAGSQGRSSVASAPIHSSGRAAAIPSGTSSKLPKLR
jgi:hypothetical protein